MLYIGADDGNRTRLLRRKKVEKSMTFQVVS
nr:MAG TPA: hypothetical protein [Caudoviricetes sp.]